MIAVGCAKSIAICHGAMMLAAIVGRQECRANATLAATLIGCLQRPIRAPEIMNDHRLQGEIGGEMSITIPLTDEQTRGVSDGYHTFEELYDHRIFLYLSLCVQMQLAGTGKSYWMPHYPGWPVLFLETEKGQISYHFKERYLPIVEKYFERSDNHKWDGHTSADVLRRLEEWLK